MQPNDSSAYVLVLDSSTPTALLGLCSSEHTLFQSHVRSSDASIVFMEQLHQLQAQLPSLWSLVSAIIVGIGPGSYTGLRVAFLTAAGLARAKMLPLYAASSLAAYAYLSEKVLCCLDARAGGLYVQPFENGFATSNPMRIAKDQAHSWQMAGYSLISPDAQILNAESERGLLYENRLGSAQALWRQARLRPQLGRWQNGFADLAIEYLKADEDVATKGPT